MSSEEAIKAYKAIVRSVEEIHLYVPPLYLIPDGTASR